MNHPNRNWRARMRSSFERWLLGKIPADSVCMASAADIREYLRLAYTAGYIDGRESIQRRKTSAAV